MTEEEKLAQLRQYLATAKDLTVEQKRDLQREIAQMELSTEREHQQDLLALFREGYDAQRRVMEAGIRADQKSAEDKKRGEIDAEKAKYDGPNGLITLARNQLEVLQAQSREIERQNRLLDLQNALREKDRELEDVRKLRNRVVIEYDASSPFGLRFRRTHDEAKERELLKDRAEIEKDLAEEQAKQARDRQLEGLQQTIQTLEDQRDAKLASLNQELADMRTKHSEEMTVFQTYWDTRLSTQSLQLDLEKTAWKTHYKDVERETEQWVRNMNAEWAKLQKPVFETGADLMKHLGGITPPPAGAGGSTGSSSGSTTTAPAGPAKIEVNNYGANHYNGVQGVEEAVKAMVRGFTRPR